MADRESPNPRARRSRRMREDDDATTHQANQQEANTNAAPPNEGQHVPPVAPQAQHQAAQAADPNVDALGQMFQLMVHAQQQQQAQFNAFLNQQAMFQQQLLAAQVQARRPQKKKGDIRHSAAKP